MKRLRISGMCLSTVLAICAFSAGTAAASLPETGRCLKVAMGTGIYAGPSCVTLAKPGKGTYEWTPVSGAEKQTFSGSGLESIITTVSHPTIKCLAANLLGEWTGPKVATVTIEFQACTDPAGQQCTSPTNPQNKTEIKTMPLEAELGFIKHEEVEGKLRIVVGLDLKPTPPLTSLAAYECGTSGEVAHIEGSVIGKIGPVGKMTTASNLVYFATKSGEQRPESFQEASKDTLTTTFTSGIETLGSGASALTIKEYKGNNANPLEIKTK